MAITAPTILPPCSTEATTSGAWEAIGCPQGTRQIIVRFYTASRAADSVGQVSYDSAGASPLGVAAGEARPFPVPQDGLIYAKGNSATDLIEVLYVGDGEDY